MRMIRMPYIDYQRGERRKGEYIVSYCWCDADSVQVIFPHGEQVVDGEIVELSYVHLANDEVFKTTGTPDEVMEKLQLTVRKA